MAKILYIDTETTDLKPELGNIKEIGYLYELNGKIINKKLIKGTERQIYQEFVNSLDQIVDRYDPKDKIYLVGHNISFDVDFMRSMFLKNNNQWFGSYFYNPGICTMNMAAIHFMGKVKRPENFKLITLLRYYKIPFMESKLHSALYDAEKTKLLFKKLKK